MPSFKFEDIPDLQGRVAIVTGGTSGIGEVCVRELARKGCRVYLFARNQGRAEEAMKRMHEHSKDIKGEITYTHCDTSDFETVKAAVQQFKSQQDRLDILINNAGIMAVPYSVNKDGIEIQQATNAVGPAILTLLLLDVLIRTARETAGKYSVRIVQTSSSAEYLLGAGPPKQSWDSLDQINREKHSTWSRYGQSKVANVLLSKELSRILSKENICNVSLDPGGVKTGLQGKVEMGVLGWLVSNALPYLLVSPDKGALSSLYGATSTDLNDVEKYNGLHLAPNAKHSTAAKHSRNQQFAQSFLQFVKTTAKKSINVDLDQEIEQAQK